MWLPTMNKNGKRVSGFTIMNNHHPAFVDLQSGSFVAKDNHMTKGGVPRKPGLRWQNTSYGSTEMVLKHIKWQKKKKKEGEGGEHFIEGVLYYFKKCIVINYYKDQLKIIKAKNKYLLVTVFIICFSHVSVFILAIIWEYE